jgi:tetratricopeptide (TPR) repeat protein
MSDEEAYLDLKTVQEVLALLKERPDDAALYQHLGCLHAKQFELMEAWEAFMQSLRLNPDDPWTCLKFANLLTLCENKQYARDLLDYAIKLEPELAAAHWCSADLHCKQGEYELAEHAYERAVEVEPENNQAREKLAEWRSFILGIRSPPTTPASGSDAGVAANGGT